MTASRKKLKQTFSGESDRPFEAVTAEARNIAINAQSIDSDPLVIEGYGMGTGTTTL